jgi:protein-tyrosine phosphatase
MFSFFSKKKEHTESPGTLSITTDIHSHILPGIDDGSPDIETSLQLVKGIYNLGIRKSIATPHVISDMFRNTPETINAALKKLQDACVTAGIDIELSAAAEYMLDDYFVRLLATDKSQLLKIHDNIILTEQSYASPTGNLNEIAFELAKQGFRPIMAHPERYYYYHTDYEKFYTLKDMGFLLQVNLLSLIGYYGPGATKAAKFLFKENLVDLVGTDMHHLKHLALLQKKENQQIWQEYFQGKTYNDFSKVL